MSCELVWNIVKCESIDRRVLRLRRRRRKEKHIYKEEGGRENRLEGELDNAEMSKRMNNRL